MNTIFFSLIAIAYLWTAWIQVYGGLFEIAPMQVLSLALIQGATDAVTLAIGLVGAMTLFLGLMKVIEEAGVLLFISRLLHPVLRRLFPDVP
ncbi:spore maturation protein, partial [bacterium]|nr:spore maturation protein [bacterium]